jgi:hypothetical protein
MQLKRDARALFTRSSSPLLLEVAAGAAAAAVQEMPHKTDSRMHVHGTRGVHGKLLDDGPARAVLGRAEGL